MKKLKRFSIFLLIGILLFSLLFPACGTNNQSGSNTGNSNTATDSPNGSYTPLLSSAVSIYGEGLL